MTAADKEQEPTDQSGTTVDTTSTGDATPYSAARAPEDAPLESLTSGYIPDQHETYLEHLNNAISDSNNLNIALTGRYGTGKSSILDQFESQNKKRTLRITVPTLAPSLESATLTNRIQKEIVKQLLYRASPRNIPHSHFTRIVPFSWARTAAQSAGFVVAVGLILAFTGWLPHVAGTEASHDLPVRIVSGVLLTALATALLASLRRLAHGRLVLSDVSAVGTGIKMIQTPATYFDEYLEEIVYFFDTNSHTIVIFEDLDRFDDPHIFEGLRELNTLLNHTPRRTKKKRTLQFVYAIKDSLFERLGAEATVASADDAAIETERANRTKFFDLVIPLVPFISYRNARELLDNELKKRNIDDIDRGLVSLIAQHATDMRLLKNICNEYTVFAARLLPPKKSAPGLTPSNLFALVTYKNFHLKDFEEISRRHSRLDDLYDSHRALVRSAINSSEARKRNLLNEPARHKSMQNLATQLRNRIVMVAKFRNTSYPGLQYVQFVVNSKRYSEQQAADYKFWAAVAEAGTVSIGLSSEPTDGTLQSLDKLNRSQLESLVPECFDADRWSEIDDRRRRVETSNLDKGIKFLQGADFSGLAAASKFTLPTADGDKTFSDIVDSTLSSSPLARELIRRGHLDRNFALYAAQFYGNFTGVRVANFIVQTVQPNKMDIDYEFDGPESIENLLLELQEEDFLHTVSAYNIKVLDYLLAQHDIRAEHIVKSLISDFNDDAKEFLKAYFNSGSERARLAARLSALPWRDVFTYLIHEAEIPSDARSGLVDAALRASARPADYNLDSTIGEFIVDNYLDMTAFTDDHGSDIIETVITFIKSLGSIFSQLRGLDRNVRDHIVREHLYVVTADNLRAALDIGGEVSLDQIRAGLEVYEYCKERPGQYFAAVKADNKSQYAIRSAETLIELLSNAADDHWEADDVQSLIELTAPESCLDDLDDAPKIFWPDLAAHHLFTPTVHNVKTYLDNIGKIDRPLADLITQAKGIQSTDDNAETQATVAIHILAGIDTIPDVRQRIALVASLDLGFHLVPDDIQPAEGNLLALLLEHDVVDDSHEIFIRFQETNWATIEAAIQKSRKFAKFMTPELVSRFLPDLLGSVRIPRQVSQKIIRNLSHYIPEDDTAALSAVGSYVLENEEKLTPEEILRIASATHNERMTCQLLTSAASPKPSSSEIVAALTELGEGYSYFASNAKKEFTLPVFDSQQKILRRLKQAGIVYNYERHRSKRYYTVWLPEPADNNTQDGRQGEV